MKTSLVALTSVLVSRTLLAATWYVGTGANAQDAAGYGTAAATPFFTLEYAVGKAADNDTILLEPGVYNPHSEITVNKAITITGGPNVFMNGASLAKTVRFMIIDNADAVVDGLCFSNKEYTVNSALGAMVQVKSGTLRNSVVAECAWNAHYTRGNLANTGGNVINCKVINCKRTGGNQVSSYGIGYYQSSGMTSNLVVRGCTQVSTYGCGVSMTGGTIDDALVEENGITSTQGVGSNGAGVYMEGGELKNSIVRNNSNLTGTAGVYVKGSGRVTNCEIYGNRTYEVENATVRAPGLYVDSASASVTDTVITNNVFAYQPYPDCYVKSGATFENNTVLPFAQTAVKAYVSAEGSSTYPYDTPEKATENVCDALNALCRDKDTLVDLYVGEGTFYLDNALILNRGVRVHGAGRDRTIIAGHGSASKKCRGFLIEDDNALVENLTVYNTWYYYYNRAGSGVGAKMSKGTIRNVLFRSCTIQDAYQFATVYMTGGLLADSEITDSYTSNLAYEAYGAGLYIEGGLATNCVIHGNTRGIYTSNHKGGHGVYVNGGTVDACVITNNGHISNCSVAGSGLYLEKGCVRNSLIAGNLSKTGTAGVYIKAGTFENNTVVGNVTATDTTGQSGATINGATAIVRNNIFYGNGAAGAVAGSINYTAGILQTNIVDKTVAGTGNINANPALDAEFRPQLGSPAIDAAAPVAAVDHDIVGTARPNGDGPDIGCHEFDWSKVGFTAKISISQNDYPADGETAATATAVVVGASGEVAYEWYLDDGDEPVSTAAEFSSAELTAGHHALRLVVTSGGDVSEDTNQQAFNIRPLETYASPKGSNTYPYDTAQKAAHCLNDAVAALWNGEDARTTVHVGAGVVTLSDTINIQRAVRIIGAGKDVSVLDGRYAGYQGFILGHDDILLENLCISNFSYAAQAENGKGAGVKMTKGTVRNCHFTRNRTNGAYQSGSAVHVAGGLLTDTEIDHCQTDWEYLCAGGAIYLTGGVVSNCWIHNLTETRSYNINSPGGLAAGVTAGLMTHCLIESNTRTQAAKAGVVSVSDTGVLRNTIIRNNTASSQTAGLYVTGGRVEHCTVYNNNALSTSSGNSGLVQSGGTIVNSIFYGNGSAYASLGSVTITGGIFATNLIDVANANVIGCTVADPGFVDVANNDLHLKLGSAAIDKGAVLLAEDYDYDGVLRDENPDLGAYEYVSQGGPLAAGITIDQTDYPLGAEASAVATVEGADTDIVEYGWYIVEGEKETKIGDGASVAWTNAPTGVHTLKLYVRNQGGEEDTIVQEGAFNIHPYVTFAATDGASVYPYDTPAKAATNVIDAYAAVWSGETESNRVVNIAAGSYPLTDGFTLDRPVSVIGAGMDLVVLDGTHLGKRGAILSDDGALLQGVTISNIQHAAGNGVGINMSKGTLRDVRVTKCQPTANSINGIGLYMAGGLVEDCEIVGNSGAGCMYGATAVGAYVAGGTFRGGSVSGNVLPSQYDSYNCVGLLVAGGLAENVVVASNAYTNASGAIAACAGARVSGGTLRNALIYGNSTTKPSSADGIGLHVEGENAKVVNCTVVDNHGAGTGAKVVSGSMVNTIVANNPNGDLALGAMASVTYSRYGELAVVRDGNTAADPKFRSPARGDWRILRSSPCVNTGVNEDWMAEAVDLLGSSRVKDGRVDMGCYENPLLGTVILIR